MNEPKRARVLKALRHAGKPSNLADHPLAALEISRYHRAKDLRLSGWQETPESLAESAVIFAVLGTG